MKKTNAVGSKKTKKAEAPGVNCTLMAVGAHADDIELNVGGTLLKYQDAGYGIVYVMSTNNMSGGWSRLLPDGSVGHTVPSWDRMMPRRKREAAAAAKVLGAELVHLDHPQRHFQSTAGKWVELRYGGEGPACAGPETPTILTAHEHPGPVRALADLILARNPEAVITHGIVMVDMEHVGTCLLVTKAYWQAVADGYQGMLLHWHDITVGFYGDAYVRWDTHVDVTDYWERKLALIGKHACQMPDPGRLDFPPVGVACGCGRAEVFKIVSRGRRPQQGAAFNFEILINAR